jgi:hypothetical protein
VLLAPLDEVTLYEVMAFPPVAPGVNDTVTVYTPEPAVAVPIVGACGTVVAVIEEEEADAFPLPEPLDGVTLKVYAVAD